MINTFKKAAKPLALALGLTVHAAAANAATISIDYATTVLSSSDANFTAGESLGVNLNIDSISGATTLKVVDSDSNTITRSLLAVIENFAGVNTIMRFIGEGAYAMDDLNQTATPSDTLESFIAKAEPNALFTNNGFRTGEGIGVLIGQYQGGLEVEKTNNMTPVPLSPTLPLLLIGLGAMGLMRTRRKPEALTAN